MESTELKTTFKERRRMRNERVELTNGVFIGGVVGSMSCKRVYVHRNVTHAQLSITTFKIKSTFHFI